MVVRACLGSARPLAIAGSIRNLSSFVLYPRRQLAVELPKVIVLLLSLQQQGPQAFVLSKKGIVVWVAGVVLRLQHVLYDGASEPDGEARYHQHRKNRDAEPKRLFERGITPDRL